VRWVKTKEVFKEMGEGAVGDVREDDTRGGEGEDTWGNEGGELGKTRKERSSTIEVEEVDHR
jgi:hypothetical protein